MIVEDQLDRGAGRIGRIEQLEELDELSAAVAVSDQGMHLAGEQIDPGQQAERAMAFVLIVTREGRVDAGFGRQIRRSRRNGLDSRLFIVGDDRRRLARFARSGGSFLQDLDLAINAQNLRHLLLELGVAAFQVVAHFVRLDFLLAENFAHRCPEPSWRDIRAPPPVPSRAHGVPAAVSSTTRADSRAPWPCRMPETPTKPWPPA